MGAPTSSRTLTVVTQPARTELAQLATRAQIEEERTRMFPQAREHMPAESAKQHRRGWRSLKPSDVVCDQGRLQFEGFKRLGKGGVARFDRVVEAIVGG